MNITKEDLQKIYYRIIECFYAKYGKEDVYYVKLDSDGNFYVEYLEERGCCGSSDIFNDKLVSIEDLSEHLDILIEQRKKREAEEAERQRILEEEKRLKREIAERENRKMTYYKLKREFENE